MSCKENSAVLAHNNYQLYYALQFTKHLYMHNLI